MQNATFPLDDAVEVFIGVAVGQGHRHAVALDRNGRRLVNQAPANDKIAWRALIAALRAHGQLLFVVDPSTPIGALPLAVAHDAGVRVAELPAPAMRRIADRYVGAAEAGARNAAIAEAARVKPQGLRARRPAEVPLAGLTLLGGFDEDLTAPVNQPKAGPRTTRRRTPGTPSSYLALMPSQG